MNFLDKFPKYPKISYFMKIPLVGTELFYARKDGRTEDRQTDRQRDGQT